MNLSYRYRLADGVAVRPERFGGLAYNYHNRSLYFLHSRELTDFVSGLDGDLPLAEALDAFRRRHDLPAEVGEAMLKSLAALETKGIVAVVAD